MCSSDLNQFRIVLLVLSLTLFAGLAFALLRLRKAHDLAERTSRQFRDAAQSIGEGFAFFDGESRLSFWNSTFEKLHKGVGETLRRGVSFEEFQKACLTHGVYNDLIFDEGAGNDAMSQALGHAYVIKSQNDTWMLASDGRMADGGTASVRIDITEQKHSEEELRKLSRAVEQSPASVMITDTNGVITYVNPKFEDATGYTAIEAIGQRPQIIGSGEKNADAYDQLWKTISSGGEWRGEFHNKRKDGTLFWEYASISPIKNERGEITSYVAVKEDITDRKNVISELMSAKEQAELASHAKTQFLANMSHELRTPLNAIIGFSEMIMREMFGPVGNSKYLEYNKDIPDSGQHLLELITDILDMSKIESGNLHLNESPVEISRIAQACQKLINSRAYDKDISLLSDLPYPSPVVMADSVRLKQIFINLLTNSVKYTPRGGAISMALGIDDRGGLQISITDTGIGMTEEDIPRALEPFSQIADIMSAPSEGVGLGLYLTRSLVEMHGGELQIDSTLGHGTTVTVHLPRSRVLDTGRTSHV